MHRLWCPGGIPAAHSAHLSCSLEMCHCETWLVGAVVMGWGWTG